MVLGDDFDGEMVFKDIDVGVGADSLYQALLYLETGVVGVMEDAELRVSPFAVEVKRAVILLVEVHPPLDELPDLAGGLLDDHLHGCRVADPVACHHRVVDMLVEVVDLEVGHRGHSPLGQGGVGFFEI